AGFRRGRAGLELVLSQALGLQDVESGMVGIHVDCGVCGVPRCRYERLHPGQARAILRGHRMVELGDLVGSRRGRCADSCRHPVLAIRTARYGSPTEGLLSPYPTYPTH